MLMTYIDLCLLIDEGVINADPSQVNAASIDVRLGDIIWVEDSNTSRVVDLHAKDTPSMRRIELLPAGYALAAGEFILASTIEVFNLPNDIACEFKLKSSLARAGLNHSLAGWADPGWHGSTLTLELHNALQHNRLLLRPGMKIGQMVFFRGVAVPDHASYATRGQYNGDREATPSKGVR